jgi:hypothetical protein
MPRRRLFVIALLGVTRDSAATAPYHDAQIFHHSNHQPPHGASKNGPDSLVAGDVLDAAL